MVETAHFRFTGRLDCRSFIEFAHHRARRLDLMLTMGDCTTDRAEMTVRGDEVLVDAFEMACSLGPYDCMILDVARG